MTEHNDLTSPVEGVQDELTRVITQATAAALKEALPGFVRSSILEALQEAGVPARKPKNLARASARNRATHVLLVGFAVAAVWGIVNGIGQATDVNWFDKAGWQQVITLLVSSVVTSVGIYFVRLFQQPGYYPVPSPKDKPPEGGG